MSRYHSQKALVFVAICSLLAVNHSQVRRAHAENTSVVDLEGDTHHDPPSSTTDKSSPAPAVTPGNNSPNNAATQEVETAKQKAAVAEQKRRAGERVGSKPVGKAHVFGMSLQEGTHSRPKVIEVTLNSPAYDAGVMKGDEISVFQGFRGESYREWIDGIRRLTTDTGAGLKIPVVLARDGKQVTVQIEVQPKPAPRPTGRALSPGSPLIPPGVGPALPDTGSQPAPVAVGGNGGNNVVINNDVGLADSVAATPNERAVAHIVRIGGQPSSNPPSVTAEAVGGNGVKERAATQKSAVAATSTPPSAAPRIGMAGFRDDPTGMVVMVDVGALSQGTYSVTISIRTWLREQS